MATENDRFTLYPGGPDLPFDTPSWLGGGSRRTPDNLRRDERRKEDPPRSRIVGTGQYPVGLYYDGTSVQLTVPRGNPTALSRIRDTGGPNIPRIADQYRQAGLPQGVTGGSGQGIPGVDMERINRYFGSVPSNQERYQSEDPAMWDEYLNEPLMSLSDAETVSYENTESDLIFALMSPSNTVKSFYDRAITLSREDPEEFVRFQMQLVAHGFMPDEFLRGEMDPATMTAIQGIIDGKRLVGDDKNMTEFLADARRGYFDHTFERGMEDLEEFDKESADALRAMRQEIENMDINLELSNPEMLRNSMQDKAISTLGRRLTDEELNLIVIDVHEEERKDFYTNNPVLRDYQNRVKIYEDAMTNVADRRQEVLNGASSSDLDTFMEAIMTQESGGDPNAVNKYSGAFGMFQFMPETWRGVTRNAGLDPNDRGKENQIKAARYLMAQYFKQFGNWRDVAIAWYAGPGATSYSSNALNRQQANGHPSIASYADEVLSLMDGTHRVQTISPGDAVGAIGGNGMLTPQEIKMWARANRGDSPLSGNAGVSDLDKEMGRGPIGDMTVYENVAFDVNSYLQSAVTEAGGVDADAYQYASTALNFFDLLGER